MLKVQLFINLLEDQAGSDLSSEASPLRMPNSEPELREWQAIEHIYREGLFAKADYTALLSPKFPIKTGVSFEKVVAFIEQNPGYDVYLFDHGPQYRYYNFNIFDFAENIKPGIQVKFIECLDQVGERVDFDRFGRGMPENWVHANSWVGNASFWQGMVAEALDVIGAVRDRPSVWRSLCEPSVANGHIYPFLPSVLERYVPYWLMTRSGISVKTYPHDKASILARCVRPLERPFVEGFYELFNDWDRAGPWSPDKRAFIRDISHAFNRQLRSANEHMIYPWTGERILPVK